MASHGLQTYFYSFSIILFLFLFTWHVSLAAPTTATEEETYSDYDDAMAKRHLGSIAASSGFRSGLAQARTSFPVEDNIYKFKRFLGSLARGGWFPRQFRGFVYANPNSYQQQKRHIGSVARLGWLPYKNNREDYHM